MQSFAPTGDWLKTKSKTKNSFSIFFFFVPLSRSLIHSLSDSGCFSTIRNPSASPPLEHCSNFEFCINVAPLERRADEPPQKGKKNKKNHMLEDKKVTQERDENFLVNQKLHQIAIAAFTLPRQYNANNFSISYHGCRRRQVATAAAAATVCFACMPPAANKRKAFARPTEEQKG